MGSWKAYEAGNYKNSDNAFDKNIDIRCLYKMGIMGSAVISNSSISPTAFFIS